jgi:hypothetical protein
MFTADMNVVSISSEREFSITILHIIHKHNSWVQVECLFEHTISVLLVVKLTNISHNLHVSCYMRNVVQEENTFLNNIR